MSQCRTPCHYHIWIGHRRTRNAREDTCVRRHKAMTMWAGRSLSFSETPSTHRKMESQPAQSFLQGVLISRNKTFKGPDSLLGPCISRNMAYAERNTVREEQWPPCMPSYTVLQMFFQPIHSIVYSAISMQTQAYTSAMRRWPFPASAPHVHSLHDHDAWPQTHALATIDTAMITRLVQSQPFCFKISLSPSDSAMPCVFDLQYAQLT